MLVVLVVGHDSFGNRGGRKTEACSADSRAKGMYWEKESRSRDLQTSQIVSLVDPVRARCVDVFLIFGVARIEAQRNRTGAKNL